MSFGCSFFFGLKDLPQNSPAFYSRNLEWNSFLCTSVRPCALHSLQSLSAAPGGHSGSGRRTRSPEASPYEPPAGSPGPSGTAPVRRGIPPRRTTVPGGPRGGQRRAGSRVPAANGEALRALRSPCRPGGSGVRPPARSGCSSLSSLRVPRRRAGRSGRGHVTSVASPCGSGLRSSGRACAAREPRMCPAVARRAAPRAPNVCRLLSRRARGFYARDAGVALRKNMGLLRTILCQESTKFKNVWTTHSASPIAYERGRIYLDNYRCCISSIAQEPRILYQKPKCSKSEKIEDALLLECPLGEMLPNASDYKPSLIVLTVQNWLLRLSADCGEILEKVYLAGSCCKFRYLSWDTPQEVMVVKSAQNKLPAAARQAGIQQSVLFHLAVFQVLPLSFIGMLPVTLHEAFRPCPLTSGLPAARGARARHRVVKAQGALNGHRHTRTSRALPPSRPPWSTRVRCACARTTTVPMMHLARPALLTP